MVYIGNSMEYAKKHKELLVGGGSFVSIHQKNPFTTKQSCKMGGGF
jgi:hypothetical protein